MRIRQTATICFLLTCSGVWSQNTPDSVKLQFELSYPRKAIFQMNNDSRIAGAMVAVRDTNLVFTRSKIKKDQPVIYDSIPWTQLKAVRVKRGKFTIGLLLGAIGGGLAGYYIGAGTYEYDYSISDSNNEDQKRLHGVKGAVIAGIPAGLVGGFVGLAAVRVRFEINGNRRKLEEMIKKSW